MRMLNMDARNIIAAYFWAIVCAGAIYGQTVVPTATAAAAAAGQTDSTQGTFVLDTSTAAPTDNNRKTVSTLAETTVFVPETSSSSSSLSSTSTTMKTTSTSRTPEQTSATEIISTTTSSKTTTPEDCMLPRKDEFIACFEGLGNNAVQYIASKNLTGFLDDICDVNRSKPYMECIKRHFRECPDFLNRIEVQVLQFGPYHIKDIIYFSSIDQMCSCATGLVCIQELLKVKQGLSLTSHLSNSPWPKLPNYKAICDNDTSRFIACVRKNLRQCQSPLTKRYGDDFTNEDAEDIKRLYDFTKEHCDVINEEDFSEKYKCIEEKSSSDEFRECIQGTEGLPSSRKICRIRECVKEVLEDECDYDKLIPLYIDAVNVYRRDSVRLLNKPCTRSSASEIGISVLAVIAAFFIVVLV